MAKSMWDEIEEEEASGEFIQSNNTEPMPEGTRVLATIEDIGLDSFPGSDHEHINIKRIVDEPLEYKGRKFFQPIYINGSDPSGQYYDASKQKKNKDDALRMLFAIDKNSGGKMYAGKLDATDDNLKKCLIAAQMQCVLGVTKNNKQTVRGVSPKENYQPSETKTQTTQNQVKKTDYSTYEDDLPF